MPCPHREQMLTGIIMEKCGINPPAAVTWEAVEQTEAAKMWVSINMAVAKRNCL